jgi:hypothetical protein
MNATRSIVGASVLVLLLAEVVWLHTPKPPNVPVSPVKGDLALGLRREGRALRVSWDRNSEAIRHSNHGTLNIIDGIHNTKLELNAVELRAGKLVYWPENDEVSVRLEVNSPTGMTTGTLQSRGVPPPPQAVAESEGPIARKPSPFDTPRRHPLQKVSVPPAVERITQSNEDAATVKSTGFFGRLVHKIPVVRRLQKSGHRPTASSD